MNSAGLRGAPAGPIRVLAVVVTVAMTAMVALLWLPASSGATTRGVVRAPVTAGSDYLALGDSVSFGYREPTTSPAPDYHDAGDFVGYPEEVASALGLKVANLACPGETSSSMIHPSAPSYGCESLPVNGKLVHTGYRTLYPLHVHYSGSQLSAGLAYLRRHPHTTLVSLMIGANDGFLCQATTSDHCSSPGEEQHLAETIEQNVTYILTKIRSVYRGQIVVVSYYSTTADGGAAAALVNHPLDAAAKPFGVELASGAQAFAGAAKYSAGNPCTAGLLTQLSSGGCGVHPSPAGQDVLAHVVEAAVTK